MIKVLKHFTYKERMRDLELFSLGKSRHRNGLTKVYNYLKGECRGDRARLFPVLLSDNTKGNGHRLKHRGLLLNIRKHFFTVMVTEHWCRLPREVV